MILEIQKNPKVQFGVSPMILEIQKNPKVQFGERTFLIFAPH
jgi:hypothetical protein